MLYVESHDRFAEVGQFDPATTALRVCNRLDAGEQELPLRGHFASLAGHQVIFYRDDDDTLRIACGNRTMIARRDSILWTRSDGKSRFIIEIKDLKGCTLEYWSPAGEFSDDPTACAEPEDGDFGLFIFNVINDEGRANRIYR